MFFYQYTKYWYSQTRKKVLPLYDFKKSKNK